MKIQELIQSPEYKKKFVLEKLLCHYLNKTRTELWTDAEEELDKALEDKVIEDYRAYEEDNKPLEYLLWYVEFFWIKFFVNENTLVPRPETEYMITAVTEFVSSKDNNDNILLDIWTGSWVLACSVLLQNEDKFDNVFMVDISDKALEVARKNYLNLIGEWKYHTEIMVSDLCSFLWDNQTVIDGKDIVLVANLPYIPTKTFEDNAPDNVQKWEPKVAFVWWDDWLDLYRTMFRQLEDLTQNVHWLTMFLEMMTWQIDILREEFWDKIDFEEVKTFHFNIRIVKAKFKK